MNQFELTQSHMKEFEDEKAYLLARQTISRCSCQYDIYAINVGTNYFRIEERLEQFDPYCIEHGTPECLCFWGMSYGDWVITEYNEDCPIHGEFEE